MDIIKLLFYRQSASKWSQSYWSLYLFFFFFSPMFSFCAARVLPSESALKQLLFLRKYVDLVNYPFNKMHHPINKFANTFSEILIQFQNMPNSPNSFHAKRYCLDTFHDYSFDAFLTQFMLLTWFHTESKAAASLPHKLIVIDVFQLVVCHRTPPTSSHNLLRLFEITPTVQHCIMVVFTLLQYCTLEGTAVVCTYCNTVLYKVQ